MKVIQTTRIFPQVILNLGVEDIEQTDSNFQRKLHPDMVK